MANERQTTIIDKALAGRRDSQAKNKVNSRLEDAYNKAQNTEISEVIKRYKELNKITDDNTQNLIEQNAELKKSLDLIEKQYKAKKRYAQEVLNQNRYENASLAEKYKIIEDQKSELEQKISRAVGKGKEADPADWRKLLKLDNVGQAIKDEIKNGKSAQALGSRIELAQNSIGASRAKLDSITDTNSEAFAEAQLEHTQLLEDMKEMFGNGDFANGLVGAIDSGLDFDSLLGSFNSILYSLHDALDATVDAAMKEYDAMGKWESRLQGLDEDISEFSNLTNKVTEKLSVSKLVKATDYLHNIESLAEKGIAYNLEQRALIQTIGDRLVSTFEVNNETLLRLVRLQQADMTYSSLGTEAQLTQFLNGYFQDTSYLNSMYDSVSNAILEATSTMDRDSATSFSYSVQKWLAALYSVGLSDKAVSTIAQGINYLGTGNYSALGSNTALQTLLNFGANNAGLSYTSMLTQGVTSEDINDLMKGIVSYLQQIVDNTGDNVTKSAWSTLLGLDLTDFRAISNLTDSDIATVYSSAINYAGAMSEYQNQINQLTDRTSIATRYNNLTENIKYTFGNNIADNEFQYATWKLTGLANDIVSTLHLDQNTYVKAIMAIINGANLLVPAIETITDAVKSFDSLVLSENGYGDLFNDIFDLDAYTSRGVITAAQYASAAEAASLSGAITGLSYSGDTNSVKTSSKDAALASLADNASKITASTVTDIASLENSTVRTVDDLYGALIDNHAQIRVVISGYEDLALEKMLQPQLDNDTKIIELLGSIDNNVDAGQDIMSDMSSRMAYMKQM